MVPRLWPGVVMRLGRVAGLAAKMGAPRSPAMNMVFDRALIDRSRNGTVTIERVVAVVTCAVQACSLSS